jgi:ribose transport system ATP-binding protein
MPLLELQNICKSFGRVEVLHDVSLAVDAGQTLGLVGENGSGKSTAMNIVGGVLPASSGCMLLEGNPYEPTSPRDAQAAGIAFIHQELNLFENLSIEENLFIGGFPRRHALWPTIDRHAIRQKTRQVLEILGLDHSPATLVSRLRPGERQLVEIAKALNAAARLIILDEPTTSLTDRETERLFTRLEKLKTRGIAMIYISHILDDVLQFCDDVVVLRDGSVVHAAPAEQSSQSKLVSLMVGRTIEQLFPPRAHRVSDKPLLEVESLSQPGIVHNISFVLHAGEVLGIAGLMGSGRSELLRILYGLDPFRQGQIKLAGRPLTPLPRTSMAAGMALLTEDRRRDGLMMSAPILDNLALPSLADYATGPAGMLRADKLANDARQVSRRLQVSTDEIESTSVQNLSGGNQQKVVLAKWLMRRPTVFVMDEPTRGIDIGAKHEIYRLVNELVAGGAGVLMVASEIEELVGMCDRILVMSQGCITAQHQRGAFDNQEILQSALWQRDSAINRTEVAR